MIELRHLKAVAALADRGSVTRAAESLRLTQSALSHQIAALEASLGLPLFERQRRPLRLTDAGEAMLRLARQVLPSVEETRKTLLRMKDAPRVRTLRIAAACHACHDWLMPAMDTFRERHADVEQDIVPDSHAEPLDLLTRDLADVVLTSEAPRQAGIFHHPLFSYEIVALTARDHALVARPHLTPRNFENETLITYPVPDRMLDLVRRVLKPAGVTPRRRTAEHTATILQLVASGHGIAALPRWAVQNHLDRGYVAARPIGPNGLWARLYLATREDERQTHADFAALLVEQAFSTLPGLEAIAPRNG